MLVSIDTSTEKPLPLGKGGFTKVVNEGLQLWLKKNRKPEVSR